MLVELLRQDGQAPLQFPVRMCATRWRARPPASRLDGQPCGRGCNLADAGCPHRCFSPYDHGCAQLSYREEDVISGSAQRLGGALREQRAACARRLCGAIRRSGASAVSARRKGTRSQNPPSLLLSQAVKCDPTTAGGRARRALPKVSSLSLLPPPPLPSPLQPNDLHSSPLLPQSTGKPRVICLTAKRRTEKRGFKGTLHVCKLSQGRYQVRWCALHCILSSQAAELQCCHGQRPHYSPAFWLGTLFLSPPWLSQRRR